MSKTKQSYIAACVSLALSFIFSCSSGNEGGLDPSSSSDAEQPSSSSSVTQSESSSSVAGDGDSSSSVSLCGGQPYDLSTNFCDTRDNDNKLYKYTQIGTQTWMAENLNYDADGSKCYNDDPTLALAGVS